MGELATQKLLSVREAAKALGLTESGLRQWVLFKQIEYVRIGRLIRFRREAIEDLIRQNIVPAKVRKG